MGREQQYAVHAPKGEEGGIEAKSLIGRLKHLGFIVRYSLARLLRLDLQLLIQGGVKEEQG